MILVGVLILVILIILASCVKVVPQATTCYGTSGCV
mgnify:CR=1 FL=1